MSRNQPRDLLYVLDRPLEPSFYPKADKVAFELPPEYYTERLRPLQSKLSNRFGGDVNKIQIKKISIPDLTYVAQLGKRENFSPIFPFHRQLAARLIEIFMGMKSIEDLTSAAVYCKDRLNPYLFNYALSVAMLHRPETKNLELRSLCNYFPGKFLDRDVFARAREEATLFKADKLPIEIPLDFTATDKEIEHRVAYFREDVGLNNHHWHWHLVYPFEGPMEIVNKNRRGELFYYHHQQIMARYNFERFCNDLGRVKRLSELTEPIEEGYFPKLDSLVSSRNWPPRFGNTKLRDVNRSLEQLKFDIADLKRWTDRIYAAIHVGEVVDANGQSIVLNETEGIDILGNIIEACMPLTVNPNYYGDLHNFGHAALGLLHDPDNRNLEPMGVIADLATSMRDPVFYRWHAFIDDIFQEYKSTLPAYPVQQLDYPGIKVTGLEVQTDGGVKNQFDTFWQKDDIDLSAGMDFVPRNEVVTVRITHLQHTPFSYKIDVENSNNSSKLGTVRIFMAPKFEERGVNMFFRDQKNFFIELDKFIQNFKPGRNTITRKSSDSSVTIPFERTFRNLAATPQDQRGQTQEADIFNFCGCGWPQHLLIPKGSQLFSCDLFVMVSNFDGDRVNTTNTSNECATAASYCGVRDSVYPDKRAMGYPFDRRARPGVDYLNQFLTPNMKTVDVKIKFRNNTPYPPKGTEKGNQTRRN